MFGYATSMVYVRGTYWLAVGQPWAARVQVYTGSPGYWMNFATITDDVAQVWPMSLFGYSVAWSPDENLVLAVGVPGRSPSVSVPSIGAYYGAVKTYQMLNNGVTMFPEIDASSAQRKKYFNDRFGSKVKLVLAPPSNLPSSIVLLVACSGGWEGVSAPGVPKANGYAPSYGADFATGEWPAQPTTQTANTGVYMFSLNVVNSMWVHMADLFVQSKIPFGALGVEFDAAYTLNGTGRLMVAMRDIVNNVNVVSINMYDANSNSFFHNATIQSSNLDDWFGAGIALDCTFSCLVIVAAPKRPNPVAVFSQEKNWSPQLKVLRPKHNLIYSRSFFGGTLSVYNGTLLISDATSLDGPGSVQVLKFTRQSDTIAGYDTTIEANNDLKEYGSMEESYYTVNTLVSNQTSADHFGKSTSIAADWIVVGAPAVGCIYMYKNPIMYSGLQATSVTASGFTPTTQYVIAGGAVGGLLVVPIVGYIIHRRHKRSVLAGRK